VSVEALPDARGRFGEFGGRYVPEILIPALDELDRAWHGLKGDRAFQDELGAILWDFVAGPLH